MSLIIAAYGFFLFPTESGGCRIFAAPKVSGRVKHRCEMLVHGNRLTSTLTGVPPGPAPAIVELDRTTLHVDTANASAQVRDFAIVPSFETLKCGARLKKKWATEDPPHTELQVRLNGGELFAAPDEYTNTQQFKWPCNGQTTEQPVTALAVYNHPTWPGRLSFKARPGGSTQGELVFGQNLAIIALRHVPIGSHAPAEVDEAHAEATARLCQPPGGHLEAGTATPKGRPYSKAELPNFVYEFFGLKPSEVGSCEPKIDFKGRPNCGARQMAVL